MKVQDSKYYQDFSYVLKVGQSINDWRDSFKKTMHTAGFYFTGQVDLQSRLSAKVRAPVVGIVSGARWYSIIWSIKCIVYNVLVED